MSKHAYLIMIHNNKPQVLKLLKCLDYDENDIYIHIDKKSALTEADFTGVLKKSRLFFSERCNVSWGSFSVAQAELNLLKAAVPNDRYEYYHLLSGADFPLKTQEYIHEFFDTNKGLDFVSMCETKGKDNSWWEDRIKYYYHFQEKFGRGKVGGYYRKATGLVQKILHINRMKKSGIMYAVGSQFFSITHDFAEYVVSNEQWVKDTFRSVFCVDELFLQTLWLKYGKGKLYRTDMKPDENIQVEFQNIMRAIDWHRGSPYLWKADDYEWLINSDYLFVRKTDCTADGGLVDKICEALNPT